MWKYHRDYVLVPSLDLGSGHWSVSKWQLHSFCHSDGVHFVLLPLSHTSSLTCIGPPLKIFRVLGKCKKIYKLPHSLDKGCSRTRHISHFCPFWKQYLLTLYPWPRWTPTDPNALSECTSRELLHMHKWLRKIFFKTQQIAAPRIVVEMKMEQIENFKILQNILPLTEAHLAEHMIAICTAITNLYPPLNLLK